MAAQQLIYETAVPLSKSRHAGVSVELDGNYAFSRSLNSVPLTAVEFPQAAAEYAIVFTASGDEVVPAVILGARATENLYLTAEGQWQARYIPAFLRRYPFVFSSGDDGRTFTLCVDEAFAGLNRQGRGHALFTEDAKPTPYLESVLKFLQEYQAHFVRTKEFCAKLKALQLLAPMQAQFTLGKDEKMSLTGFMAVDRAKLKALGGEELAELAKSDELELVYLHLQSMRNFVSVKDRLVLVPGGNAEATATAASATDPQTDDAVPADSGKPKRGKKSGSAAAHD